MKKLAFILSALILSAGIFSGCTDKNNVSTPGNDIQSDNTPSAETENVPAEDVPGYKELYIETVNELNARYEDVEWTYGLIDVNGDETPELVASYPATVSLYTYADGKVYVVMEEVGYGFAGNNGYSYLPGKNVIFNSDDDLAGAVVYENYCKISESHELENYHSKPLYKSYWKDANGDGVPDDNEFAEKPFYYYGNEELTEAAFNEMRFGEGFEGLYGDMTYDEIVAELGK